MGNYCASAREKYEENKHYGNDLYIKMSQVMKTTLDSAKGNYSVYKDIARLKYEEGRLRVKGY